MKAKLTVILTTILMSGRYRAAMAVKDIKSGRWTSITDSERRHYTFNPLHVAGIRLERA